MIPANRAYRGAWTWLPSSRCREGHHWGAATQRWFAVQQFRPATISRTQPKTAEFIHWPPNPRRPARPAFTRLLRYVYAIPHGAPLRMISPALGVGVCSRPSEGYAEALQAARRWQRTDEFRQRYAARAGVEATHAQAIRRSGLRRARYIGLAKTRLQHVTTAAAVNVLRITAWCAGTPLPKPAACISQICAPR